MMPEGHRLGGLQMGEARHRVGGVLRGAFGQRPHEVAELAVQPIDGIAHPEAKIGGDLVVAAAPGVQALAGLADPLGEPRLDIHVNILQHGGEIEGAGLDLGAKTPALASISAWAIDPRISCRHILRSKPIEALISCMMAAGPAANRPPHCGLLIAGGSAGL
jgi:hypothetical protein